jgi:SulP family sulfate permease
MPAIEQQPKPVAARYLPGLSLFRGYRRKWLLPDLTAGLTVCLVTIPAAIAYAGLMGLAPQHGLYAALIALAVFPFFTTSRHVIAGPDIAISLLIASAIGPLAGGDPVKAAALASVIALVSGVILLAGARFRIGAVADFFSKPVLVGYMTGAALILIASQLNKLFGIGLQNSDFFPRLFDLATKLPQAHAPTLAAGATLLAMLFLLRAISPKIPAAVIVCACALAASVCFHLENAGIRVVGAVPQGLPAFALPSVTWQDIHALAPAAIGVALLTYTEGILLARAFAASHSYEVDANRELRALGAADFFTGLFQGFAVTGSQSRTTVNASAGARTQLSGWTAALCMGAFVIFLTPVIKNLPEAALAAVLVHSGLTLLDFKTILRIRRCDPGSAAVAVLTMTGVLALGVVEGIVIGVAISLLGLIRRLSHPPDAVLREVPGHGLHDLGDGADANSIPGLVAYRFYAPLLFSNAGHFLQRVRQLTENSATPIRWFVLDAQAITDIDVTAAESLHAAHKELARKRVALKIVHANRPLREALERNGLAREIGAESFFDSIHECVEAFQRGNNAP